MKGRLTKLIALLIGFILCTSFKTIYPEISRGGGDFNVYDPDYDYLNNLILEKINEKRLVKNDPELEHSVELQKTAIYITRELKLTKFEQLRDDRHVLMRKISLLSWKYGYSNNMLNVIITEHDAVNYVGGDFYFDKEDTETFSHLFYGIKPTKKEKEADGFKAKPIKNYTYDDLAEIISKKFLLDKRTFKCLNSGYSLVGCSCYLEKKNLHRRRIPFLKAIFILGGKRIVF